MSSIAKGIHMDLRRMAIEKYGIPISQYGEWSFFKVKGNLGITIMAKHTNKNLIIYDNDGFESDVLFKPKEIKRLLKHYYKMRRLL